MPRRSIDTKTWSDNWFTGLDPLERYLFIYFCTNEHTSLCGIYELPLRIMAFETGLDMEMLAKIMKRFSGENKIFYKDGWIYLTNYEKYQVVNESMKINAEKARKRVPELIIEHFNTLCRHSGNTDPTHKDKDKYKYKDKDTTKEALKKIKDSIKGVI